MTTLRNKIEDAYSSVYIYLSRISRKRAYFQFYQNVIDNNPMSSCEKPAEGENAWLKKWQLIDRRVSPKAYRVFSRYVGPDITIMPLELINTMVEPVLTPENFSDFYSDKNTEFLMIPPTYAPKTFLRNIGGKTLTNQYDICNNVDTILANIDSERIVLKPSRQSSGKGVKMFYHDGGCFRDKNGVILSAKYLNERYEKDYLIQDCLIQSESMAYYNPSSVNTIRMATYRDEKGVVHPLRTILRIGSKGAEVDNAHAGGVFCGVNNDGSLGNFVCDALGRTFHTFNEIDFKNESFTIPDFEKVQAFAIDVSKRILHHDLVALDIALDVNDNPQLIEYNVYGFGAWPFQFTIGGVFGEYTDEIVDRCQRNKQRIKAKTYLYFK